MTFREPGVGGVVGRYRLEREIGRGGFGAVYAAQSTVDGARVALKVLSRRMLEESGGERRFRREAELAGRLRHPNTVRVLDAGTDAAGVPFIAFELLEGRSLENEIERWGAMPPARAVRIAIEVLAALEEAHALGVIHRDLKPANIHLSNDGDRVKVLDFGIAKSTNPATLAGLTQEGMALGTPAYMAPEQVTGAVVGPGTDIFALGVVLIEMLVGRPLYGSNSSPLDILRDRLAAHPVPVEETVCKLPIGWILQRAVAPRPDDRFANASEMRRALADALPQLVTMPVQVSMPHAVPSTASAAYARTEAPRAYGVGPGPAAVPPTHLPTATGPAWAPPPAAPTSPGGHGAWLGPPVFASPPEAPRRGGGIAWIFVVGLLALAALVIAGAIVGGGAIADLFTGSGRPQRPRPTATSPTGAPPTPLPPQTAAAAGAGVVRPCPGIGNVANGALAAAVTALGWSVDGEALHCHGNMINFRCDGPQGRGLVVKKGDEDGTVVILKGFATSAAVDAFVADERDDGTSLGVGTRAVLRVEMPPADAARVLDRVCK